MTNAWDKVSAGKPERKKPLRRLMYKKWVFNTQVEYGLLYEDNVLDSSLLRYAPFAGICEIFDSIMNR
jgi:hypothetical protein